MREEIQKLVKLEGQVKNELLKIEKIRRKPTSNNLAHESDRDELISLLSKIKESDCNESSIHSLKNEFCQIRKNLRDCMNQDKKKAKLKRDMCKDMKQKQKEEKKKALSKIDAKFTKVKLSIFKDDSKMQENDIKHEENEEDDNDDSEILDSEKLENILNEITQYASMKSEMKDNEIIKDVGSRKINNKYCLPIVNIFTNWNDLNEYLLNSSKNANCFELIRIFTKDEKEYLKCNLLLSNYKNEWISKGEIYVNNKLRSKLRELFLSDKFANEMCPVAIRKFYADTYFGGKYNIYGKNICDIKSICYRSIVESFRDEAINKINQKDLNFLCKEFGNKYTLFDPFAGTGNWAILMSKLLKCNRVFLWEIEKNVCETIIENNNNNNNGDKNKISVFNHTFEIIPKIALDYVGNVSKHVMILLSPPWGEAFKPGIGIDLTKGIFPISTLLSFYEKELANVNIKVFVIQVDKHISNFGNILDKYQIVLRNDHLLIIQEKSKMLKQ